MSLPLDLGSCLRDKGAALGTCLAPGLTMIRDKGHLYRFGAMGALVEKEIIQISHAIFVRAQPLWVHHVHIGLEATVKPDGHDRQVGRINPKRGRIKGQCRDLRP